MEKAPASSAYEYVNPAASTNRTSRTIQTGAIKLTPEEIEQDRKLLLEGQGGCCKLWYLILASPRQYIDDFRL